MFFFSFVLMGYACWPPCRLLEESSYFVCHILKFIMRYTGNNSYLLWHFKSLSFPLIFILTYNFFIGILWESSYISHNLFLISGDKWLAWSNRTKSACQRRCTGLKFNLQNWVLDCFVWVEFGLSEGHLFSTAMSLISSFYFILKSTFYISVGFLIVWAESFAGHLCWGHKGRSSFISRSCTFFHCCWRRYVSFGDYCCSC